MLMDLSARPTQILYCDTDQHKRRHSTFRDEALNDWRQHVSGRGGVMRLEQLATFRLVVSIDASIQA